MTESKKKQKEQRIVEGPANMAGSLDYEILFTSDGRYTVRLEDDPIAEYIAMMTFENLLQQTIEAQKQKKIKLSLQDRQRIFGAEYIVRNRIQGILPAVYLRAREWMVSKTIENNRSSYKKFLERIGTLLINISK
jgi:hypothetical protein